ncbi:MAG: hypothetical protein ABSC20_01850 [Candidatus Bathyarchaeia archaeon]|jgi:hypothetical protein
MVIMKVGDSIMGCFGLKMGGSKASDTYREKANSNQKSIFIMAWSRAALSLYYLKNVEETVLSGLLVFSAASLFSVRSVHTYFST